MQAVPMTRQLDSAAPIATGKFSDTDNFVPPFPPRLPTAPSTLTRLRLASKNFLAMWEDESFDLEFSEGRVLTRKVYVCNSPRSVKFAFSEKNASFERKSPQMRHALEPLLGDGLFVSDGETWRTRRKVIAPVVHVSRLSHFAPIMTEAALETRERWQGSEGLGIDVLEECAHLTAEIISRTVFGRELGRSHAAEVVQGFSEYQNAIGQVDVVSLLGLPDWVPRYRNAKVRKAIKRIHAVLDDIIAKHRTQHTIDETSVVGSLLSARDDQGRSLSDMALRNEAAVLFMAGHETTANTLAWAWYLLSQAPKSEARLHKELDSVLGDRLPLLEDTAQLPYTRAVINETMRLYPPVPILPREALVEEQYDEYTIPKGSLVLVVPWLLHRHRKLWVDPDHFIPERFLAGSPEPVSKFAYVPFSIGPRICAGMSFGALEAVLCLATLAQKFQLELRQGHCVEPVCRLTLRPGSHLPMIVRKRTKETIASDATGHRAAAARPMQCPQHND